MKYRGRCATTARTCVGLTMWSGQEAVTLPPSGFAGSTPARRTRFGNPELDGCPELFTEARAPTRVPGSGTATTDRSCRCGSGVVVARRPLKPEASVRVASPKNR